MNVPSSSQTCSAGERLSRRREERENWGLLNPKVTFESCLAPNENKPEMAMLVCHAKRTPCGTSQPSLVAWAWAWAAGEGKGMPRLRYAARTFFQTGGLTDYWEIHPWTLFWIQIFTFRVLYSESGCHIPNLKSKRRLRQKLLQFLAVLFWMARGVGNPANPAQAATGPRAKFLHAIVNILQPCFFLYSCRHASWRGLAIFQGQWLVQIRKSCS